MFFDRIRRKANLTAFRDPHERAEIKKLHDELTFIRKAYNHLIKRLLPEKKDRSKDKSTERIMVNFFYESGLIRHKDRTWDSITGVEMANVAEHVFRVSWIAAYLVLKEGGTVEEAMMAMAIALAHDAGELRTGDQNPFMKAYVEVDEERAIRDLFTPLTYGAFMMNLYRMYKHERATSLPARCVKDADILDSAFEMMELESTGHMYPSQSRNQLEIKLHTYATKSARELHEKLIELGPEARWDFRHEIESTFKQGKYGK